MITLRLTQHRFMIFGRPAGPWRDTRAAAQLDAIRQRMGSKDRDTGQFFVTVPGWIASRDAGWVRRPESEMPGKAVGRQAGEWRRRVE
jgi:hypothetical protein